MKNFSFVTSLAVIVAAILALGGWVLNIIAIVNSGFAISGMLIARVIGVFMFPLGSVLGYIV